MIVRWTRGVNSLEIEKGYREPVRSKLSGLYHS